MKLFGAHRNLPVGSTEFGEMTANKRENSSYFTSSIEISVIDPSLKLLENSERKKSECIERN